jgi:hypothetical protein
LLLMLLGLGLGAGAALVLMLLHLRGKRYQFIPAGGAVPDTGAHKPGDGFWAHRPASWLVIHSRNLKTVQSALGLHNPKPCTWAEGMTGGQGLFIAPPLNGWVLVSGSGLPEPADDIDVFYRFLRRLSRKTGAVQYFNTDPHLGHHAWVWMTSGRVIRAYVWTGRTVWNQGRRTPAEQALRLTCFPYFEAPEPSSPDQAEVAARNTEKVPMLAAQWSFDPAAIRGGLPEHALGVVGEVSRLD